MRGVPGYFDGAVDVSRENSAADPTVGAGCPRGLATSLYPYPTVQHLCTMYVDSLGLVFEASACCQAVVMLVDRRGDDALALEITDETARQYIRLTGRVEVVCGVDCVGDAKDGDLPALDQGTDPGTGHTSSNSQIRVQPSLMLRHPLARGAPRGSPAGSGRAPVRTGRWDPCRRCSRSA